MKIIIDLINSTQFNLELPKCNMKRKRLLIVTVTIFKEYLIIKNAGLNDQTKLCILSYNSRGFSADKQEFCKLITSKAIIGDKLPILCNQENFLLRGNSYKINQALKGYYCIINPAIKETHDRGRARNGMFIAVPEIMKSQVNNVSPGFWRLQAITIKSSSSTLLLINSYFPNDPKTVNFDDQELLETFRQIKKVIESNDFDILVLCGDINADFSRNTGFVNSVKSHVDDLNLETAWEAHEADFTFMYNDGDNRSFTAMLDHFFYNEITRQAVLAAGVIHLPENLSDHCPIFCTIDIEAIPVEKAEKKHEDISKPSWKKATEGEKINYSQWLEANLSNIQVPESLPCKDVKCRDSDHCKDADEFITSVLECVDSAATSSLPSPSPPSSSSTSRQNVPGWKEFVKPFKENAYFWHQVWISAEKPINTELHRIMKRTKNIYHYHFRKCQKSEEKIVKNKFLDACINGNGDIFKEIKKLRATKPVVATCMDGVQKDIAGHFKSVSSELYNSLDCSEDLLKITEEVESKVTFLSALDVEKVNANVVKEAASHLKDSKSDPTFSFNSDCIKHGTEQLFQQISLAIQSFLVHGHVTYFLLLATLVPIIKDKLGSINSSRNYRSIAISSLMLKLLDWIILILFGDVLGLDQLQFAYQPGCSTTMCTWTVVETVDYFLRNGGEVYGCMMDMTKAFDLV